MRVSDRHPESDLLPISALQHMVFCERQCALIHVERVWIENRLTAEGRLLHERVDQQGQESRGDVHIARGLPIRNLQLGLTGIADVVEFHRVSDVEAGAALSGKSGFWRPFPVEYKRGKPKSDDCDEIQLCAQALCLEEKYGVEIPSGALFYGTPRRRQEVLFDVQLRSRVREVSERLHQLVRNARIPSAVYSPKCDSCSLFEYCQPKSIGCSRSAKKFWDDFFQEGDS